MRRITTIWTLAAFMISLLATPLALAADSAPGSIVGVVYRGWSQQDCEAAFNGKTWGVTNDLSSLNLQEKFKGARGPLTKSGAETGCYCGKTSSGDYIMDASKTGCVLCKSYEKNAVYYTDEEKAEPSAVITVGGKDVGCRCAKKEGNKDFERVEGNACKYVDRSGLNSKCQGYYGTTGVRACTNAQGEVQLGTQEGILCCCEPGYDKKQDTNNRGGLKCEKTTATPSSAACANRAPYEGFDKASVTECPDEIKQINLAEATSEQRVKFNSLFAFTATTPTGQSTMCCCANTYIRSGDKCVKDIDECTAIVPGSVKEKRTEADTKYKVGDPYNGIPWDSNLINKITENRLTCYCKKGTVPYADENKLTRCIETQVKKNVAFVVLEKDSFYNYFDALLFPKIIASNDGVIQPINFEVVNSRAYDGVILADLQAGGTIEVDFYNEDTSRANRAIWEALVLVASMGAGGLASPAKKTVEAAGAGALRFSSKASQRILTEGLEGMSLTGNTLDDIFRAATMTADDAAKAAAGGAQAVDALAAKLGPQSNALFQSAGRSLVRQISGRGAEGSEILAGAILKNFGDDGVRMVANSMSQSIDTLPYSAIDSLAYKLIGKVPDTTFGDLSESALRNGLKALLTTTDDAARLANLQKIIAAGVDNPAVVPAVEQAMGKGGLTAVFASAASRATATTGAWGMSTREFLAKYGLQAVTSVRELIRFGFVPVSGITLTELWDTFNGERATGRRASQQPWETKSGLGGAVVKGAETFGIGLIAGFVIGGLLCPVTACISVGAVVAGAVIAGVGTTLIESNAFGMADATEMQIRYNGQQHKDDMLNVVLTNAVDKCTPVKEQSGLRMLRTTFNSPTREFSGWSLESMGFAKRECSFLTSGRLSAAGGYSRASLFFGGKMNACTGCTVVSVGTTCPNGRSLNFEKPELLRNLGITKALCCEECKVYPERDLASYYGLDTEVTLGEGGLGL